MDKELMPGIKRPIDWWWKDKSWWLSEKLWKALLKPIVEEYLRNNDPEKDDPLYLEGLMSEFDFRALDTKLIELLQFADEAQERNAGLTKTEGE
ncbi:MAG: hypothetical protein E2P05_09195 [Acidobacteria bacterium]|nr:MAG: hypothetical protein E2P05_09195 [Acidobacteriota bacterium]